MSATGSADAAGRAAALAGLFVRPVALLGTLTPLEPQAVPEPFRSLLDHESHMTVAMERHHRGPMALRVLAEHAGPGDVYAREIVLSSPAGRVVQFGIVRIDLRSVDPATASRIRAGGEPLGRILVEAGALCVVGDVALLGVTPGPHLRALIGSRPTFGRVAAIALDGRPAVHLLEIAAGV